MKKQEIIERVNELMQERQNLTREHEELILKDKLLTEQLSIISDELAKCED